jgi:hypothetical protein
MDLDEAANVTAGDDADAVNESDEKEEPPENKFGAQFNFGPKPLAPMLGLTLVEKLKWGSGFPLSPHEIARRMMATLDTDKKGTLPLEAFDFILRQIQGQLPLSKETWDLAEVCPVAIYALQMRW